MDGWLDEVLYEHTQQGLLTIRFELSEGVSHLIVMSEDMMKFKAIKLLLEHPYLLAVCRHAVVATIWLPQDLVDDELRVPMNVEPLDIELGGDAHAVDEGLIFRRIVGCTEM
jgi:hypothetical protein